jgi:hypothetical protein
VKLSRLALLLVAIAPATAAAHAFDPAVVAVSERAPGIYDVVVKPSAAGLVPQVRWPEGCTLDGTRLRCTAGTATVSVGDGEALVRFARASGELSAGLARPDAPFAFALSSDAPATKESGFAVVARYGRLGVRHILTGWDHLLLVLLLLLLVEKRRSLLLVLSAFTLGHSVTLGLSATGAVTLPAPPVEATIALSLVLLARPLLRSDGENSGLGKRPWAVALACGLLHGFGFAGALAEVGLPPNAVAPALFGFNLGVEVGQVAVVALLWLGARALRARRRSLAFVAGAAGAWLLVERTVLLVGGGR